MDEKIVVPSVTVGCQSVVVRFYSTLGTHLQGAGVLEGFQLFLKYDYIKGIFAMSCLFMVEVTILDYTMKVISTFAASLELCCGPNAL